MQAKTIKLPLPHQKSVAVLVEYLNASLECNWTQRSRTNHRLAMALPLSFSVPHSAPCRLIRHRARRLELYYVSASDSAVEPIDSDRPFLTIPKLTVFPIKRF